MTDHQKQKDDDVVTRRASGALSDERSAASEHENAPRCDADWDAICPDCARGNPRTTKQCLYCCSELVAAVAPAGAGTPVAGKRCTECQHVFSAADLAAEDPQVWGHPCHAGGTRITNGVTPCESFREPIGEAGAGVPPDALRSVQPRYDPSIEREYLESQEYANLLRAEAADQQREMLSGTVRQDAAVIADLMGQLEAAERARDEKAEIIAALAAEKEVLRCQASAADHRQRAAEHRAQRIVLDAELKARAEAAEATLATLRTLVDQFETAFANALDTVSDTVIFAQCTVPTFVKAVTAALTGDPAGTPPTVKEPNPCPACVTFLGGDTRLCWRCARTAEEKGTVPPAPATESEPLYFVAISGDAATRKLVRGRAGVRAELSEQFFGPEGPQTDEHREEEAARWRDFLDVEDHWTTAGGQPFAYEENGEDYGISIYPVDADDPPARGAVPEARPPQEEGFTESLDKSTTHGALRVTLAAAVRQLRTVDRLAVKLAEARAARRPAAPDDALDIYVPGRLRCPRCAFELTRAVLHAATGEIGMGRREVYMESEPCPNDGTPMARVTWQQEADSNQRYAMQLIADVLAATGADSLPAAFAKIKEEAASAPAPHPPNSGHA